MERERLKRLLQDLAAELTDQAIALRYGDEDIWREDAESRMLPACERLKTVKLACCENHKGLKTREEFSVFQCTAKVPLIEILCKAHIRTKGIF